MEVPRSQRRCLMLLPDAVLCGSSATVFDALLEVKEGDRTANVQCVDIGALVCGLVWAGRCRSRGEGGVATGVAGKVEPKLPHLMFALALTRVPGGWFFTNVQIMVDAHWSILTCCGDVGYVSAEMVMEMR